MSFDPALFQPILERAAWLGLVVALDFILGVTVAIKERVFEWSYVSNYLETYGLKAIAWFAVEVLDAFLPAEYKSIGKYTDGVALFVYGTVMVSAVGSILGHVQSVFGKSGLERFGVSPTWRPAKDG